VSLTNPAGKLTNCHIAGTVSMLISAVLLAQVSSETGRAQLILDVIFMGIGGGLSTATQTIAVQHAVPSTRMGVATSAVIFARSIGAALGTGTMGALMTWRLSRQLASGRSGLDGLAAGHDISAIVRHSTRAAVSPEATMFFQRALASSLRSALVFVLAATIAATIISFFVPGGQAKDLGHPEHH